MNRNVKMMMMSGNRPPERPMQSIGFDRAYEAMQPAYNTGKNYAIKRAPEDMQRHHHGMDVETARKWVDAMENEDGSTGPHWSLEQVKKTVQQRGINCDPVEMWTAMNMIYSDYSVVAKKLGVNTMDFYVDMARAFLDDRDAGADDKLSAYYYNIVLGD